jgi:hypothetical protein
MINDLVGRELYTQNLNDNETIAIGTFGLSAGIYSWKCSASNNSWSASGKLVITK